MKKIEYATLTEIEKKLIIEAIKTRENAYSPYSQYKVGAAVLDINNNIHTGCNVESADYTLTTHAEMLAIDSMVKSGVTKVKEVAVVVKSDVGYGFPCGLCRQKIREFALNDDIIIYGVNLDRDKKIKDVYSALLSELLPGSFGPEFL
ncbi:MAG: cytidine deaminase [Candidatus Hydrogenedentota bacterium]